MRPSRLMPGTLWDVFSVFADVPNNSPSIDTSIHREVGLLIGGHKILSGIANSSLRVDCIRNQYHQVHRVTAGWVYDLASHN